MDNKETIYKNALKTPKVITTMTIHLGIKDWCKEHNVIMSSLINHGFRHLLDMRTDNERMTELEEKLQRMEKNIVRYQALLTEYRSQEIKKEVEKND